MKNRIERIQDYTPLFLIIGIAFALLAPITVIDNFEKTPIIVEEVPTGMLYIALCFIITALMCATKTLETYSPRKAILSILFWPIYISYLGIKLLIKILKEIKNTIVSNKW